MRRPLVVLFLVVLIVSSFLFAARRQSAVVTDTRLRVVTTFLPIWVFTSQVAGADAVVTNLLPPGAGPHEYSLRPDDVQVLAQADVIVQNGLGLEGWLQGVITTVGTHATLVTATDGITVLAAPKTLVFADATATTDSTVDPHAWLDPVRAAQMVRHIGEALAARDPAHAQGYRERATTYANRLMQEFGSVTDVPAISFVAFHPSFQYFAEHFGLTETAVIEEFPGKEPGARYLTGIVDVVKAHPDTLLFSEPQFTPKVLQTIAEETGQQIFELDPMETGTFTLDAYETIMKKNLDTIRTAASYGKKTPS